MERRLPPLNALRAFEAAGRHLSFTKAVDELHVTPAAISHLVKALEDYLGVQLFRRLTRRCCSPMPASVTGERRRSNATVTRGTSRGRRRISAQ